MRCCLEVNFIELGDGLLWADLKEGRVDMDGDVHVIIQEPDQPSSLEMDN